MIPWSKVAMLHKTWKGVFVENGFALSVLCNPHGHGKHGDDATHEQIVYRVPHQNHAADIRALARSMGSGRSLRVFEKVAINQWVDRGEWRIISHDEDEDSHSFILHRDGAPGLD
jgi:hypothetical protein